MRKVASGLFISLDGVVEAPYKWQFDVFDDDISPQWAHISLRRTPSLSVG